MTIVLFWKNSQKMYFPWHLFTHSQFFFPVHICQKEGCFKQQSSGNAVKHENLKMSSRTHQADIQPIFFRTYWQLQNFSSPLKRNDLWGHPKEQLEVVTLPSHMFIHLCRLVTIRLFTSAPSASLACVFLEALVCQHSIEIMQTLVLVNERRQSPFWISN